MRGLRWSLSACLALTLHAAESGADVTRQIRDAGLDVEECYRVRDIAIYKEDVKLYFNDGYLIFSKPVHGERLSAVFSAVIWLSSALSNPSVPLASAAIPYL